MIKALSPASRRRQVRSVLTHPHKMMPVAAAAHVLARIAILLERPNTVATSTNGPVIWSGIL